MVLGVASRVVVGDSIHHRTPSAVYTIDYHDRTGEYEAIHQERRRRDDGASVRREGVEGGAAHGGVRGHRHGHIRYGGWRGRCRPTSGSRTSCCGASTICSPPPLRWPSTPERYDLLLENFSPVTEGMVERLERWIDALLRRDRPYRRNSSFPERRRLRAPSTCARTLTRDAERRIVALAESEPPRNENVLRYVNRLSDLLFILARYEDRDLPFEITTGEMRRDSQ